MQSSEQQAASRATAPISRLHRHALASILSFSSLAGLSLASRVSKEWLVAVRSMGSISASVVFDPSSVASRLDRMLRSPVLMRHVCSVVSRYSSVAPHLTPSLVAALAATAVNLREFHFQVVLPALPEVLSLPTKLRVLHLTLDYYFSSPALNVLLGSLSALQQLETLMLAPSADMDATVDFSLLHPPQLREFTLNKANRGSGLTLAHLDQLRAPFFARLDKLVVPSLCAEYLLYLLRTPHQLRWQEIMPRDFFFDTPELSAVLFGLSRSLKALSVNVGDLGFLSHMTHLTTLSLDVQPEWHGRLLSSPAAPILAAFTCADSLTDLDLAGAPLTSADLGALLVRLPRVTSLSLGNMEALESLECFSQCKAAKTTLERVAFFRCQHPALRCDQLTHLTGLKELRSLVIEESFSDRMPEALKWKLTPPSAMLPKLTRFKDLS